MSQKKLVDEVKNKKKTTKKTVKKKSTKKNVSKKKEKILGNAPEEHYFILCNGQPIKNPKELADALENLRDDVFHHHVNNEKNDFSTWINNVFEDIELAEKLGETKNKDHTRIILYKHLVKKLHK
ncbi:DUF5752 family protein [Candidatus Woesearchaeota archaeon]|nr:DUF5752 family protein [Candidatus Woesearchaeota archaeon]MCF7901130.1 DUF5752 family protein [Candidatus Woesearchaeota archaeon]MCF8012881.1 DUF5752 family protein [Candidatus Woesearchaeota archaeon]